MDSDASTRKPHCHTPMRSFEKLKGYLEQKKSPETIERSRGLEDLWGNLRVPQRPVENSHSGACLSLGDKVYSYPRRQRRLFLRTEAFPPSIMGSLHVRRAHSMPPRRRGPSTTSLLVDPRTAPSGKRTKARRETLLSSRRRCRARCCETRRRRCRRELGGAAWMH